MRRFETRDWRLRASAALGGRLAARRVAAAAAAGLLAGLLAGWPAHGAVAGERGAAAQAVAPEVEVSRAAAPGALRWRVVDALPSRGEALSAIAAVARFGVAIGDGAGVSWWRDAGWTRAQTPAVRDLAFDGEGRLWIGTQEGLFVWAPQARPQRRPLRDGDASGRIARIESVGGGLALATESGAYWSASGRFFQSLQSGSADQGVSWLALRGSGSGAGSPLVEVWSFGAEGLVRTRGVESASGLRLVDRIVWPLPRPLAEAAAVDLVVDPRGERLHVVYGDVIAWIALGEDLDPRAVRWHFVRPVLPPGAMIRRLVFASDASTSGASARVWLATDHGLHAASSIAGPYARETSPAGERDCLDVAQSARLPGRARALALCRGALLALVEERPGEETVRPAADSAQGDAPPGGSRVEAERAHDDPAAGASATRAPGPGDRARRARPVLPADPPVEAIRARALERVGLGVERADTLWQGLRRKALWPSLQLRGAYDADRDRGRTRDQTFVSGDTRDLLDLDLAEASHYGATLTLDWELGGIAYPDQSVDLYRELRQVTSLRDDVSDEIHQLYFERQRIRARLAQGPALAPGEAEELTLRAAELDAGLDAWSGGFVRAWRAASGDAPPAHPGRSQPAID